MIKNIGKRDRLLRLVVGVVILGAGWYFKSLWGIIGIVPLVTAVTGWCPLYCPLKISTTKAKDGQKPPAAS